jgi:hypothetical protein
MVQCRRGLEKEGRAIVEADRPLPMLDDDARFEASDFSAWMLARSIPSCTRVRASHGSSSPTRVISCHARSVSQVITGGAKPLGASPHEIS